MAAYINVNLHNDMNHPQWFTVVDNVAGQPVFDANMDTDEVQTGRVACDAGGQGDITYTPRGYVATHRDRLSDGDTVDMS